MKVRPLHDRIIVERIDEGEQKIGGIIIPDTAKEKPMQGKVIAVGKGRVEKDGKVTPLDVKADDTVLGDGGGAELLVEDDVAPLGAERDLHRVGELVDAAQDGLARLLAVNNLLCHVA